MAHSSNLEGAAHQHFMSTGNILAPTFQMLPPNDTVLLRQAESGGSSSYFLPLFVEDIAGTGCRPFFFRTLMVRSRCLQPEFTHMHDYLST